MQRLRTSLRADHLALALSLLAALAAYLVAGWVFERIPHLEDEFAFLWQAQAAAHGKLTLPSPPSPRHFLVPFVVDYEGQRFGKYPPGWPAMLGIGIRLGLADWVNPLLAALGVWLAYRLGKKVFNPLVGLLAAFLTLTSPFFLLNSGSLLSHPMGLFLSAAFAMAWLDAFGSYGEARVRTLALVTAALSMGLLALTRPLTAIGVALPFAVHGMVLLVRRDGRTRRRLLLFGVMALAVASLHFVWQYALTGDPWLNPYTLWWPYDKVGFGPGVGRYGHNLHLARINTRFSLWVGARDLFGWGSVSWLFLPVGLLALGRRWAGWVLGSVVVSLVAVYVLYWVGAWLFGPRYYYEGLYSLTLLTAAGIAWLAGWPLGKSEGATPERHWGKARTLGVTALLAFLVTANLIFYTPLRLRSMVGLYGITGERLVPFRNAQAQGLAPALVIVHPDHWTEYGNLLPLETPFLDTPFIFAISRGAAEDARLAQAFPERKVFHYDPDQPYLFVERVTR